MTEWRDIPGYEEAYQASDDGRVRSLTRIVPRLFADGRVVMGRFNGRVLTGSVNKKTGYRMVAVSRNGRRRMRPVHTLVLEAFAGCRPEGMEGCHRDGTRTNNHISNLYWGTHTENIQDAVRHGTAHWKTRTHCPNGHFYDPATTAGRKGVNGTGTVRKCRICNIAAQQRYLARKKAAAIQAVKAAA